MMRNSVVLPEPLSPKMVRNSPSPISSDISRKTTCFPNRLAIVRMLSRGAVGIVVRSLLRGLHFIPYLVILGAARYIFPEVDSLLVVVRMIEVQVLLLLRRHKLRGFRICRRVPGDISDLLLGRRFDHVL